MYLRDENEYVTIPSELKQTFRNQFTLKIGENQIIKMRNDGVITDRDIDILNFLYKFKFATIPQIVSLLENEYPKESIKNRLDKLVSYRVLNKFMLSPNTEPEIKDDALMIYCMDLGGRFLLSHYSNLDVSDWYTSINMKSSEVISKNILATEFYLQLMKTCKDKVIYYNVEPELSSGKKNIIPTAEFCLNVNGMERFFIVDCFREIDFPIQMREKVNKLEMLLCTKAWQKYYNTKAQIPPVLLCVGDSDLTASDIGKMVHESTTISAVRMTTDERIQQPLYEVGVFLEYLPDSGKLQEKRANTFRP